MTLFNQPIRMGILAALLAAVAPASQAGQITTYTYTAQGQISDIDGPRTDASDITHLEYDATLGYLTSLTDALGHKWQYLDYNAEGQPTRILDANAIETQLTYEAGRITQMSRAGLTWAYRYNAVGQLLESTDPAGLTTVRTYDDARRLTAIAYPDGSKLTLTPNALGAITNQTLTLADGSVVLQQDAGYDELGRLLSAATTQGTNKYAYDANGNVTSGVDGRQQAWSQQYDALNRLATYVDTAGKSTGYRYNTQGQLAKLTDANGGVTSYTYDDTSQRLTQQSPDTGLTTYTHDEANNVTSITDARNTLITQKFDALNRIQSQQLGSSDTITYGYDDQSAGPAIGKLTSVSRNGSTLKLRYQESGDVVELSRRYQVNGLDTSLSQGYRYDDYARLQQLSYTSNTADGVTVSYHYGNDGQVSDINFTAPGITNGVVASNIDTLPTGAIRQLTLGNGIQMVREYDTAGQLKSQQWGNDRTLYSYDGNGNLISRVNAQSDTFSYDALDRLSTMSGSYNQSYKYDNVGNRLWQQLNSSSRSLSYDAASNRMNSQGSWAIVRDAAGYPTSMAASTPRAYRWNELGELQEVQINGVSKGKYSYNGWQQRIAKVVGTNTTLYDYNLQGQLVHSAYYSGQTKSWSRYYVWLGSQPLMQIQLNYTGSTPRLAKLVYLHTDQLNAPTAASDQSGVITWRWDHDPFGNGTVDKDPDGDKSLVDIQLRFPGQIEDSETGLFYNWHRYYDPTIGRYISSDPIGLDGGVNTYGYVGGNPLKYVDESGLCPFCLAIPLVCVGGGCEAAFVMTILTVQQFLHDANKKPLDLSTYHNNEQADGDKSDCNGTPSGSSPEISPDDLTDKTLEELEQLARDKGLVQDANKPNRWRDPATGKERMRIDPGHIDRVTGLPYDNPRAANPHSHGYDPSGNKIRDPSADEDPHFPIRGNY